MLTLAHPAALLLALLVPLALGVRRLTRPPGLAVADLGPALAAGGPSLFSRLPMACRLLGLACLALAVAGPGLRRETTSYAGRGLDIMLAVDLSESMAAMDMAAGDRTVTRLEAVARAAEAFAAARPGDRVGLVAFGSRAYVVMPPSADRAALSRALASLAVGAAGRRTAMGDAVALAVKRLEGASGLAKIVVVFGDGRSNAGELRPETAALAAADRGVRIFAVGVGGDGPAPFLVNHPLLGQQIVREDAPVDTAALGVLAQGTGGELFRAEDAEALSRAVAAVSERAKTDMVPLPGRDDVDFSPLAVAVAVCLLLAWAALGPARSPRWP
ncbi:VWA domain-containing protein [Solidesulfovibrio sp.]|uniref:VWA domain-containing protein n=1 Tax=Solidesulfovibrio sp. TaxID=2910990 RepID=UPI002633F728|nr:VWA domain-containing protein [Solidesulfovibrio sp.]